MANARWSSEAELKDALTKVEKEVVKSGIPMYYDDKMFINDKGHHNLVIGVTGSGKTELILLPELKTSIEAKESFLAIDPRSEMKEELKSLLKKNDYEIITIDLSNPKEGYKFNPLSLPYNLYKKDKDLGVELIEAISHYLFASDNANADPFWENSAAALFSGLALYMFDNEKEINLRTLYELSLDLDKVKKEIDKYSKMSAIYMNLYSVLCAPTDTRGSIVSVFMQEIKLYISRESLMDMMEITDFSFDNLKEGKKAIFVISDNKKTTSRLLPVIVEEFYYLLMKEKSTKNFNIILDEFENLFPIRDFNSKLNNARSNNVRFTIAIKSILELRNKYGKENAEILRMSIGNIIYLLANDNETLEEMSKLCGEEMTEKGLIPLISKEDLKMLKKYEAVILMPRMYPIKTKLKPFHEV